MLDRLTFALLMLVRFTLAARFELLTISPLLTLALRFVVEFVGVRLNVALLKSRLTLVRAAPPSPLTRFPPPLLIRAPPVLGLAPPPDPQIGRASCRERV